MSLVFSQTGPEIAFGITVGAWVISERVLMFRDLRNGAFKGGQDGGSYFWIVITVACGIGAAIALAGGDVLPLPGPHFWLAAGLALAWVGMLLRAWAVLALGRSFTTKVMVRSEQAVVSKGPYRLVRHPSYLGLLVFFLGFGLALGDLAAAVAAVVIPTLGIVKRITVEEPALRAELGDPYVEYCKGHARLFPGVW
ncbi:MAG TPA: isoprenylcysteine carboxylmethyltransferase family protein [Actinocrinis sp.]|nr:isoprenylcysteine carboxylmethyltransferase family protein [Actinocrinis sp.]